MTNTLRIASYNIGQGLLDYASMLKANPAELAKVNEEIQPEDLNTHFEIVEEHSAKKISEQADVICLQEVARADRIFIKTLQQQGFEIFYFNSNQGEQIQATEVESNQSPKVKTAIALRTRLFTKIENTSIASESNPRSWGIYGQDIASVVATFASTQTKMSFSSLHSWGFKLYNPDRNDNKNYDIRDIENQRYASTYMTEALTNAKRQNAAVTILGGDMNNNPANFGRPFNELKRQNYHINEPDQATNVNYMEPDYTERKIDYIFSKGANFKKNFWSKIANIFKKILGLARISISPVSIAKYFAFTFDGNCSDHLPIVATVSITTRSLFRDFIDLFKRNSSNPQPQQ